MKLLQQKCIPCEVGTTHPMTKTEAMRHLGELQGWSLDENAITKKYKFKSFVEAIAFVDRIATLAEKEGHHPDITILYNKVILTHKTHAIGGLSLNDFVLAAKIDEMMH